MKFCMNYFAFIFTYSFQSSHQRFVSGINSHIYLLLIRLYSFLCWSPFFSLFIHDLHFVEDLLRLFLSFLFCGHSRIFFDLPLFYSNCTICLRYLQSKIAINFTKPNELTTILFHFIFIILLN